jgi:type II secretory pathway component GspD/PulD (secretin)
LRRRGGQQNAQALKIQIGTLLTVRPLVGGSEKDGEILLELSPEVSSVDEIEAGTGLPTISLRNVSTTMRVRPGEVVLLAGLESQFETKTRRGPFGPWPGRREGRGRAALIFLVTATRAD